MATHLMAILVPGNQLNPYVQDALNQIEYCVGNTSGEYVSLRASHGREEPFELRFVEIGNETSLVQSMGICFLHFTEP